MRLLIASYCAAINPADWVPARPSASSNCAGDSPRSLPDAIAAEWVPKTGPECQPRSSICVAVQRVADPWSDLETGDRREQEVGAGGGGETVRSTVDSSAGITSEQLCTGAIGWKSSSSKP